MLKWLLRAPAKHAARVAALIDANTVTDRSSATVVIEAECEPRGRGERCAGGRGAEGSGAHT